MNITKGDVQELRRRLKKTECTFGRLCGCYVNSGKQIVTKFTEQFSELEEDEYYKYLEIAKKTFSGTLGANLLELEFDRSDSGIEHQKYLLTLKDSKLANEELLDRLYEQVIEEYSYPGNYLIVSTTTCTTCRARPPRARTRTNPPSCMRTAYARSVRSSWRSCARL